MPDRGFGNIYQRSSNQMHGMASCDAIAYLVAEVLGVVGKLVEQMAQRRMLEMLSPLSAMDVRPSIAIRN